MKKIVTETKEILSHPLENFFNLEPNTTEMAKVEKTTELSPADSYDEKDTEIEESFQEVFDKAMNVHDILITEMDDIEGKYLARIGEVASSTLSVALEAAAKKAKLKEHKDKLEKQAAKSAKTVNNTLIVNTSDLIKQLKQETIDAEFSISPPTEKE